jgi:hypothetical protein
VLQLQQQQQQRQQLRRIFEFLRRYAISRFIKHCAIKQPGRSLAKSLKLNSKLVSLR